ncbi:MAG: BCD family MFS transporter [Alphaproteobacteria bacterium]|nr:BCD family MFS transporter [Alphaproteobacteria bacterium]
MRRLNNALARGWQQVGPGFLPFANAATAELPLPRLLRLSLFQVSVGIATVLLTGTLNRVMIVELGVPALLVGFMISLPIVFAPFRALIGFKSDTHRSALGWKRVPYIWFGTLLQFGGFSILPFALIVLSGDTNGPIFYGEAGAAIAFLMIGAGLNTTQTAGLALANDLAPEHVRPRVVALLFTTLLIGMVASAIVFSQLLQTFDEIRLIKIIQGVALTIMVLNGIALWKQEPRRPGGTIDEPAMPSFSETWKTLAAIPGFKRLLTVVGLGTAAFNMQDILLEPFGGQVFGLPVGETTMLMAALAGGMLIGFFIAERMLNRAVMAMRVAGLGLIIGLLAFAGVIAAPFLSSLGLFRISSLTVGISAGLFSVGTLTAAMGCGTPKMSGILLGSWGAVQATVAGISIALSGAARDIIAALARAGRFGETLAHPATGYIAVFILEIALLLATLIAALPLLGTSGRRLARQNSLSSPWDEGRSEGYKEA